MDIINIFIYIAVATTQTSCTLYNINANDSFTLSPSKIPTVAESMTCALRCHQTNCAAFVIDGNDLMCKFVQSTSNPYGDLYMSDDIRLCYSLPSGTPSGMYAITPNNMFITYTDVYCDMDTLGGGWTVIQHRFHGSQDFYQGWEAYKQGFGTPYGEYWIGNENLYMLTSSDSYELRIEMEDDSGVSKYAAYSTFSIASEIENYRLTIFGNTGNVPFDAMHLQTFMQFSTADNDNDVNVVNCAVVHNGGWWYSNCHLGNLNGRYDPTAFNDQSAMGWFQFNSSNYDALRYSKMMIRPV